MVKDQLVLNKLQMWFEKRIGKKVNVCTDAKIDGYTQTVSISKLIWVIFYLIFSIHLFLI